MMERKKKETQNIDTKKGREKEKNSLKKEKRRNNLDN